MWFYEFQVSYFIINFFFFFRRWVVETDNTVIDFRRSTLKADRILEKCTLKDRANKIIILLAFSINRSKHFRLEINMASCRHEKNVSEKSWFCNDRANVFYFYSWNNYYVDTSVQVCTWRVNLYGTHSSTTNSLFLKIKNRSVGSSDKKERTWRFMSVYRRWKKDIPTCTNKWK